MKIRSVLIAAASSLSLASPAIAQDVLTATPPGRYRAAFGMTADGVRLPLGQSFSTSLDVYRPTPRVAFRLDAIVAAQQHRERSAAATLDLILRQPAGQMVAYSVVGAGPDLRQAMHAMTFVAGGGVDFSRSGRPLFAEFRTYTGGIFTAFKFGVRF